MITRKVDNECTSYVEQASEALRQLVAQGTDQACETILHRYPQLRSDVDGTLEVIYLESILRQDRDPSLTVAELTNEYTQRFPEFQQDIIKLLEVNRAFASLGINMPSNSGSQTAGDLLPPAWEHSIGTLGEYQLLEILGQGGMGVVYRAIQTRLGRVVAIKTIAAEHADGATISRFQKEAELASGLQHPNIVQIHEVGVHEDLPFYSMEFIAGGSLAEFLKEHPLRSDRAAKLVSVLARAIDFAHSRGIVHRDLKPANILLSPSSRPEALKFHDSRTSFETKTAEESVERFEPKIVDFGLAIQLTGTGLSTSSGRAAGTPSYMAPEQVDTSIGPTTAATDVYALGSILYHTLVGRPPFYAASTQETLRQVRDDEPLPPRKLQPKISSDLETICLKCLRKSPPARYSSAAALADDLQRFLDGKPIQARAASYPELAYKWAIRNPSLVGLIAAMLLTIISTTWLWRQSATSLAAELSERRKSEQLSYDRNIALAHLEFESHNVDRAMEILDQCDHKYRNFEWELVHNMCHEPHWECKSGNSERLTSAALSPDGRLAATGHGYWGDDVEQTIYVWDIPNNKLLWKLKGHPKCEVNAVDFHPDGKRLLTGGMVWRNRPLKGGLREWDMETGELIRVVSDQDVRAACYSEDGTRILVGEAGGRVCIYDAVSAQLLFVCKRHEHLVLSICESSDGKLLATTGRDGTIAVWEIATGREVTSLTGMGDPREIHWTRDMSKLIVCGFGGRVDTFRWHDEMLELESTESQEFTQLCQFSPDGRMLVTGVAGDSVRLLDTDDGHVIRVLHGHRAQVRAFDFDRTGRWLLTAGADGSVRLWNLMRHHGFSHMALLPTGDAKSIVGRPHHPEFAIALGSQLTKPRQQNRGGDIVLYHTLKQKVTHTYKLTKSIDGLGNFPTAVGYSPSGKYLCGGSLDNHVFVWETDAVEPSIAFRGHQSTPIYVGMPNDQQVISVDEEGILKTWDVLQQRELSSWPVLSSIQTSIKPKVRCVDIDFIHRWLALGTDSRLYIIDLESHRVLQSMDLDTATNKIAFSPDAKRLAVATGSPVTLVFDIHVSTHGMKLSSPKRLSGNREHVTSLAFSPDGCRLASLGGDEALRLYELELGNELLKLEGGSLTRGVVAFSHDGNQLMRIATHHAYTYSLERIDPRTGMSEEEAITSWHLDSYRDAFRKLHTYGAAFHCRELMAIEPKVMTHKFNLAKCMVDAGNIQQAREFLDSLPVKEANLQFNRLSALIRIDLLMRDDDSYRQHMRELESLATQTGLCSHWNNVIWFASLAPVSPIDLERATARFEELSAHLESALYFNTLALAHYRMGNYDHAYQLADKSKNAPRKPTPPPIDSLIQAMCKRPLLERAWQTGATMPAAYASSAEAEQARLFREQAAELNGWLDDIRLFIRTSQQRRLIPKKLTHNEVEMFQLEIPWLLAELEADLERCGLAGTASGSYVSAQLK